MDVTLKEVKRQREELEGSLQHNQSSPQDRLEPIRTHDQPPQHLSTRQYYSSQVAAPGLPHSSHGNHPSTSYGEIADPSSSLITSSLSSSVDNHHVQYQQYLNHVRDIQVWYEHQQRMAIGVAHQQHEEYITTIASIGNSGETRGPSINETRGGSVKNDEHNQAHHNQAHAQTHNHTYHQAPYHRPDHHLIDSGTPIRHRSIDQPLSNQVHEHSQGKEMMKRSKEHERKSTPTHDEQEHRPIFNGNGSQPNPSNNISALRTGDQGVCNKNPPLKQPIKQPSGIRRPSISSSLAYPMDSDDNYSTDFDYDNDYSGYDNQDNPTNRVVEKVHGDHGSMKTSGKTASTSRNQQTSHDEYDFDVSGLL